MIGLGTLDCGPAYKGSAFYFGHDVIKYIPWILFVNSIFVLFVLGADFNFITVRRYYFLVLLMM